MVFCYIKLFQNHIFGDLHYFVAIFCSDLHAFVWRKIEPKNVSVEKNGQISCMHILCNCGLKRSQLGKFSEKSLIFESGKVAELDRQGELSRQKQETEAFHSNFFN